METNLKTITKLCREVYNICQSGTPAVRVLAQNGLQELINKLQSANLTKSRSMESMSELSFENSSPNGNGYLSVPGGRLDPVVNKASSPNGGRRTGTLFLDWFVFTH